MLTWIKIAVLCTVIIGVALAETCSISPPKLVVKAKDSVDGDYFGWSVALSGHKAAVGAKGVDTRGRDSGSVYLLTRNSTNQSWSVEQKLTPDNNGEDDLFGQSVSMSAGFLLVSAHVHEPENNVPKVGAVYVYMYGTSGWTLRERLTAPDPFTDDQFGRKTALAGNTAVIGSHLDDTLSTDVGAVYVYENVGNLFVYRTKLVPEEGTISSHAHFGYSVAIYGNTLVVGAPDDIEGGRMAGSAFIYERHANGDWIQMSKLSAEQSNSDSHFGTSVAVYNNIIAVGAPEPTGNGVVHLYERRQHGGMAEWVKIVTVKGSQTWRGDRFGQSVAINNNIIVVGAIYADSATLDTGAVFIFKQCNGSYQEVAKLDSTSGSLLFGKDVDISEGQILVGHPMDDGTGSASFYDLNADPVEFNPESPDAPATTATASSPIRFLKSEEGVFGQSVAVSPEYAVIGDPKGTHNGMQTGIVKVMRRIQHQEVDMWIQDQKLVPFGAADDEMFGFSVDIEDEVIAVGAIGHNVKQRKEGATYVYHKVDGTWTLMQVLSVVDDSAELDYFGYAVAVTSTGNIAVSAPQHTDEGVSGAVYVYERSEDSYIFKQKIAESVTAGARYGYDIAMSHDVLVVGAPFVNTVADGSSSTALSETGTAFVYIKDHIDGGSFRLLNILQPMVSIAQTMFGKSVSTDGIHVAVGIHETGEGDSIIPGGAQVYEVINESLELESLLHPIAASGVARTSGKVDVSSGVIILGASADSDAHTVGYLFDRSSGTWAQSQIVEDTSLASAGSSELALTRNALMVGLPMAHGASLFQVNIQ